MAQLERLIHKLEEIPTLPVVANRVSELINDPKSNSADIALVLKGDQALTAKILKLVNSPYYGIPTKVTDVQRALSFLGFNTIAQLVLSMSVFSLFPGEGSENFKLSEFWKHALAVAVTSRLIGKQIRYQKSEELFTCGLLHDIGKIVLHQIDQAAFLQTVKKAKENKSSFTDAEKELGTASHSEVGALVAERWGLPEVIRNAIYYHHTEDKNNVVASVVRLADAVAIYMGIGKSGNFLAEKVLTERLFENVGMTKTGFDAFQKQVFEEMKKADSFLAGK